MHEHYTLLGVGYKYLSGGFYESEHRVDIGPGMDGNGATLTSWREKEIDIMYRWLDPNEVSPPSAEILIGGRSCRYDHCDGTRTSHLDSRLSLECAAPLELGNVYPVLFNAKNPCCSQSGRRSFQPSTLRQLMQVRRASRVQYQWSRVVERQYNSPIDFQCPPGIP